MRITEQMPACRLLMEAEYPDLLSHGWLSPAGDALATWLVERGSMFESRAIRYARQLMDAGVCDAREFFLSYPDMTAEILTTAAIDTVSTEYVKGN